LVGKVERELREPAAKGAEKRDARESRGEGRDVSRRVGSIQY
jgi:hypothetical protein